VAYFLQVFQLKFSSGSELIYLKLYGWFPEVASIVTFTWKCSFESWQGHILSWLRLVLCYSVHQYNSGILTYLFTPWCRVLLEKLTGLQLVKKFPAFYGTWRFVTALTSVRHLSLSWASPIQSTYPHPTSWTTQVYYHTFVHNRFCHCPLPFFDLMFLNIVTRLPWANMCFKFHPIAIPDMSGSRDVFVLLFAISRETLPQGSMSS